MSKTVKSLAFSVFVRKFHINGVIYNYTPRKLSQIVGLDSRTVARYVRTLIENGHACITDKGHLRLYELNGAYALKLSEKSSLKEIADNIYIEWFKRKYYQTKYIADLRTECAEKRQNPPSLKEYRRAIRTEKKYGWHGKVQKEIMFSVKTISNFLNISIERVYEILSLMKKEHSLTIKKNISLLYGISPQQSKYMPNTFVKNGMVFSFGCNSYELPLR